MQNVGSQEIQVARRNAKRTRVARACLRCKSGKIKCSVYRPCKHCVGSGNSYACSAATNEVDIRQVAIGNDRIQTTGNNFHNGSRMIHGFKVQAGTRNMATSQSLAQTITGNDLECRSSLQDPYLYSSARQTTLPDPTVRILPREISEWSQSQRPSQLAVSASKDNVPLDPSPRPRRIDFSRSDPPLSGIFQAAGRHSPTPPPSALPSFRTFCLAAFASPPPPG